jgi:hypothetical protein
VLELPGASQKTGTTPGSSPEMTRDPKLNLLENRGKNVVLSVRGFIRRIPAYEFLRALPGKKK